MIRIDCRHLDFFTMMNDYWIAMNWFRFNRCDSSIGRSIEIPYDDDEASGSIGAPQPLKRPIELIAVKLNLLQSIMTQ